ncbi:MAG: methionyl-tRNA formyltransferase [bacterium]|nr:methionyl-tRNA formyltransferase [bacterium]
MLNDLKIAFFGTPGFAVSILDELDKSGIKPDLIVTNPDEPKGRKLIITPPPVKIWAIKNNIPVIQPEKLSVSDFVSLKTFDLSIVAAYGKIIPEEILNLPKHGTLNVHPSLLPKYRGPSPLQSAILNGDTETGVSIMLLDKEMDHGPIIAQEKFALLNQLYLPELKEALAKVAGQMLIKIIPDWIVGKVRATPQDHSKATFCKKITTTEGLIDLSDPIKSDRVVRALNPDPGAYMMLGGKRVKILSGHIEGDSYMPERIIPEGKKEMAWEDFKKGNKI